MNALREQQRAFAAAVREGAVVDGLLKARPDGAPPLVGIYRHAYRARLAAAVRDNHEVLALALGDAAFDALAQAYIDAHPSRFASIRWFGDALADFMWEREDLVPHPAFGDIARMDWALRGAFDAADAPVLTREQLAALPPDTWAGVRFLPHPSVRVVPLHWAIEAAWRALREHDPASDDEPELPEPQPLAHDLLVWRAGLDTRWRSLPEQEALLLRAALQGERFGALCAHAADAGDEAPAIVAGLLLQWVGEGLFSSIG
jgi:hypothetical protein